MDKLFSLLFIICLIALIIGLIRPGAVIKWGSTEKRSRKSVLKYYGVGILLFSLLTGVFAESPSENAELNNLNMPPIAAQGDGGQSNMTAIVDQDDVDQSAAIAIDSRIEALGDVNLITLEQADEVKAIRSEYASLDSEEKAYVTNLTILSWAEEKLVSLQAQTDKEAAVQAQVEAEKKIAALQSEAEAEKKVTAQQTATESPGKAEPETTQSSNNYTVYITKTGEKYHKDGCQYLRQSKISISKSDAAGSGYTPCSRCKP